MAFPRRIRKDLMTPSELIICNAIEEVEKLGADEKLTKAVMALLTAKDLVSDYIDATQGVS